MQSKIEDRKSRIVIAGAGPAGSSLAIRLARRGFEVVLIERMHFPRQKLCGEFISPECLSHFEELGVLDEMLAAGGDRIFETRFYEIGGRSIAVPSDWLGKGGFALSLSRAEMDRILFEGARRSGVETHDGVSVVGLVNEGKRIVGLKVRRADGSSAEIRADLIVDATGRSAVISKLAEKDTGQRPVQKRGSFVGFKAHLHGAAVPAGTCEIYSFTGGYAGLSNIEGGLGNLCFLLRSEVVRSADSDAQKIIETVILRNRQAAETLKAAVPANEWLAVSVAGFGTNLTSPLPHVFTVGDAAAFIDPFTGSGMMMALESSAVLAESIFLGGTEEQISRSYMHEYRRQFAWRLRLCDALRRTAFKPRLATAIVGILSMSQGARRLIAHQTRV